MVLPNLVRPLCFFDSFQGIFRKFCKRVFPKLWQPSKIWLTQQDLINTSADVSADPSADVSILT